MSTFSLKTQNIKPRAAAQIPEPPIARFLFADTRTAWFWLILRLYIGYMWLAVGIEKMLGLNIDITSKTFGSYAPASAGVFNSHSGAAIGGFVNGALVKAGGDHPAVQESRRTPAR